MARELECVQASALTAKQFQREFVDEWRPVRIAGAIDHWPAMRLWKSHDYLLGRVGADRLVKARTHPRIGYESTAAQKKQNGETIEEMPFAEFLRRASAPSCGHLVLQSYVIGNDHDRHRKTPLTPAELGSYRYGQGLEYRSLPWLGADMDGFYFLPRARPARVYPTYRTFLFRNSYTDWHWHPTDETLMCQIFGAKEVLVLPPDEDAWGLLAPIMAEYGRTFDHDHSAAFAKANLSGLRRTVVEPGDALYIPPYWWHSVEALEASVGMTVAACWGSPITARGAGDLRRPAARLTLRQLLRASNAVTIVPHTAMVAVAVGSSYAQRLARAMLQRSPNGAPPRAS